MRPSRRERFTPGSARRACVRRETGLRRRTGGQSAVEYLVIVALLALALTVGPLSPLELVFRGFADRYQKFSYSISRP